MTEGRSGFTTGTCAAAAAKAATCALVGSNVGEQVPVTLPSGDTVRLPIVGVHKNGRSATASVKKDAGDDPDVTDGALIVVRVNRIQGNEVRIVAGEGVGTVTKPGLAIPPGEPAVNPTPRKMIHDAVREITDHGVEVEISIPGGRELAEKTFNPRLGVEGGLSILGTSGIVRPFSTPALRDALVCSIRVAEACSIANPLLVPGRIGLRAARRLFELSDEQIIEVSNEWGFMLDRAASAKFSDVMVLGHPGKLAKLPAGWWDTHSSRSDSAVPFLRSKVRETLGIEMNDANTVEALFADLEPDRKAAVATVTARFIANAVSERVGNVFKVSTVLVDLAGNELGRYGDFSPWNAVEHP